MKREGWDFTTFPHYWREEQDALVTLCGNRARPLTAPLELREGPLPEKIANACPDCMASAIELGKPTRDGSKRLRRSHRPGFVSLIGDAFTGRKYA